MQYKLDLLSKKQNMSYELLTIRPSLKINTQIIERTMKNGITRRKNDKEMITIYKKNKWKCIKLEEDKNLLVSAMDVATHQETR